MNKFSASYIEIPRYKIIHDMQLNSKHIIVQMTVPVDYHI